MGGFLINYNITLGGGYLVNSNLYYILGQKFIYFLMVLNAFLKYWPKIIICSLSLSALVRKESCKHWGCANCALIGLANLPTSCNEWRL